MRLLELAYLLAWRPFLDPMPADRYWIWMALPLIVGVCVVYKAVRVGSFDRYWRETFTMTLQITLAFLVLAFLIGIVAAFF